MNQRENILKIILEDYPDSWRELSRFRALLADYMPQNKLLRNLLIISVEEGIPKDIVFKEKVGNVEYHIIQKKLVAASGCSIEVAASIIDMWFDAFGVAINSSKVKVMTSNATEGLRDTSVLVKKGYWGEIRYVVSEDGVHISGMDVLCDNIPWKETVFVIPETIDGIRVISLMPDSLNALRKKRVCGVIVPNCLMQIGANDSKLYVNFSEKGVFQKVNLFMPKKGYECYAGLDGCRNEISIVDKASVDDMDYIKINRLFSQSDYWERPTNDCWISNVGEFIWYSGDERTVTVDCEIIESEAFSNSKVEHIVFSKNVKAIKANAVHHCDCLISLTILSEIRTFISRYAIHDCMNLEKLIGKWGENCEEDSCLYACPKLGNIIVYSNMVTCQSKDEILFVDPSVKRISNGAFHSCKNARMVVIPDGVKKVMEDAFECTNIEVVIFMGEYTLWNAHQIAKDCDLYIYATKESNVMRISPDELPDNVYFKNIDMLKEFFESNDLQGIYDLCRKNMNQMSEPEMIPAFYTW